MTVGLVLASTSEARRRILTQAGVAHTAMAPGVDEAAAKASMSADGLAARDLADALAELKALAGWRRSSSLTLGCDQVLECEGQAFDKAPSLDIVRTQLLALRGKMHRLHSAAVLVEAGRVTWRHVASATLWVRNFSDAFLDAYLEASGAALTGSVGGYHVEALGVQLFDRIDGDIFTIQGLPLVPVLDALRARGVVQT